MASIEFIQKRIAGKEKELETLRKKMGRILKAQESNWENNPYWYREADIKYTQRDIDQAEAALAGYKEQLAKEEQKAASRNVPVILEFLEMWKERVKSYYRDSVERYARAREEYRRRDRELTEWFNYGGGALKIEDPEAYKAEYNAKRKEEKELRNSFYSTWNFIEPYIDSRFNRETETYECTLLEDKLQKVLDLEANAKYDDIIEKTNAIVGQITDASGLSIGGKGELNGIIIGTNGKAKVQTFGAGGYNEDMILDSGRHGQRFHFRTRIDPIR